jgi:hypothetical protein
MYLVLCTGVVKQNHYVPHVSSTRVPGNAGTLESTTDHTLAFAFRVESVAMGDDR